MIYAYGPQLERARLMLQRFGITAHIKGIWKPADLDVSKGQIGVVVVAHHPIPVPPELQADIVSKGCVTFIISDHLAIGRSVAMLAQEAGAQTAPPPPDEAA